MKNSLIYLTKLLQIIHNFLTAKETKDFNSFEMFKSSQN